MMESSHSIYEMNLNDPLLNDNSDYHENIFCINTKYLLYVLIFVMIILFIIFIIIVSLHV
jgi:hypothetical protein